MPTGRKRQTRIGITSESGWTSKSTRTMGSQRKEDWGVNSSKSNMREDSRVRSLATSIWITITSIGCCSEWKDIPSPPRVTQEYTFSVPTVTNPKDPSPYVFRNWIGKWEDPTTRQLSVWDAYSVG